MKMGDAPESEWNLIRESVQRGQLTGSECFIDKVEEILGKRIESRSRGRPTKTANELGKAGVEK